MELKDLFRIIFSKNEILTTHSYFEFTINYKRVLPELPTGKVKFTIEEYNTSILPLLDAENIRNFNLTFHFEHSVEKYSEKPWAKDWYHSQLIFHGSTDAKSINIHYECLAEICNFQNSDYNRNFKVKILNENVSSQVDKILQFHNLLIKQRNEIVELIKDMN